MNDMKGTVCDVLKRGALGNAPGRHIESAHQKMIQNKQAIGFVKDF